MKRFLIAGVLALVLGCGKDIPEIRPGVTPYPLVIPAGFPEMAIPAANPLTKEGVALGKMLFFDPILSGDNSQSCASCHKQEFAFSDSTIRFSKGITGALGTRNAMPLFNLGWAEQYFWDGGAADLESQVIGPIINPLEMHEDLNVAIHELNLHPVYPALFKKAFGIDSVSTKYLMFAIAQFERTLISGNSRFDQYLQGKAQLTASELSGKTLFETSGKGDCSHCHSLGGLFTDFEYRNTGLDSIPADRGRGLITLKASDDGKFKTPSLRNVELTAPYMHDGRFNTLEEVINFYNTGYHYTPNLDANLALAVKGRLNEQEVKDIVAFLKTLTDQSFINNQEFKK